VPSLLASPWDQTKPPPGTAIDSGHPLAEGLRAFWPLNEGAGLLCVDAVAGLAAHFGTAVTWTAGTDTGAGGINGSGYAGPALVFDGTAGSRAAGTGIALTNQSWTVSARYMRTADTSDSAYCQFGSNGAARECIQIADSYSELSQVNLYADDGGVTWGFKELSTWHDVTITMDSASVIRVYVDGVLTNSRTASGPFIGNADWTLGGAAINGSVFTGRLAHLAVGVGAWPAGRVAEFVGAPYALFLNPQRWWWLGALDAGGGGGAQDTPELYGRPYGRRGQAHMHQLLAQ
jgi:hypothetical protein